MTTTTKKTNKKRRLTKHSKVPCGLHGAHLTSEPLAGFLSSDDTEILLAQAGVGRTEGEESKIFPQLNPLPPPPPPFSPRDWKTTSQSLDSNSGEPSSAGFFSP